MSEKCVTRVLLFEAQAAASPTRASDGADPLNPRFVRAKSLTGQNLADRVRSVSGPFVSWVLVTRRTWPDLWL